MLFVFGDRSFSTTVAGAFPSPGVDKEKPFESCTQSAQALCSPEQIKKTEPRN